MALFRGKVRKKKTGVPISSTIYVFSLLVIVSIIMLMISTTNTAINMKNAGLSAFFGIRGGIHELSSFVSRTILSVSELADLRKEYAELLKQVERYEEMERTTAEIYQELIKVASQG